MNETTPVDGALRTATLTLTSSNLDDLSMEVTYDGAPEDTPNGIDLENVAHSLIHHFAKQLILGADQLNKRAEVAERPRLLLPEGVHV